MSSLSLRLHVARQIVVPRWLIIILIIKLTVQYKLFCESFMYSSNVYSVFFTCYISVFSIFNWQETNMRHRSSSNLYNNSAKR